jgi:hypothetical protein
MHLKQNHTNDKYLEYDIRQTLGHFLDLKHRVSADGQSIVEGVFPIKDNDFVTIENVEIKMLYPKSFPYGYPLVIETSGRFSTRHNEMHVNGDGTLCLSSPQEEKINCYSGLSTMQFFDQVLVPNLSWRICVLDGIPFERKEFAHSGEGIFQSYQELLSIKSPSILYDFIVRFLNNSLPNRNDPCLCAVKKKYKACHGLFEGTLVEIGNQMLKEHLQIIGRMR